MKDRVCIPPLKKTSKHTISLELFWRIWHVSDSEVDYSAVTSQACLLRSTSVQMHMKLLIKPSSREKDEVICHACVQSMCEVKKRAAHCPGDHGLRHMNSASSGVNGHV
jgi:hypothetical protein